MCRIFHPINNIFFKQKGVGRTSTSLCIFSNKKHYKDLEGLKPNPLKNTMFYMIETLKPFSFTGRRVNFLGLKLNKSFVYKNIVIFFIKKIIFILLKKVYHIIEKYLDEIVQISSSLIKVMNLIIVCLGHILTLKFLEKVKRLFESHKT
jgi:hypothetical protein